MLRSALASALVVCSTVAVLGPPSEGNAEPIPCNTVLREPVLIFDYSSTAWSTYNEHLAVYSDGLVIISSSDRPNQMVTMSKQEVAGLRMSLERAGAFGMCDQSPAPFDAPVSTMTVFQGGALSRSHTFSFFGGGDYTKLREVVDGFIGDAVSTP